MKSINTDGKRLKIMDTKTRKEEAIIQAVEYLTSGLLEPLADLSPKACLKVLYDLIDLYDLSVALNLNELEQAIIDHIDKCTAIDIQTFIQFATECYKDSRGHTIKADSLLGKFIKANLSACLHSLVETGAVDGIKNAGGTLSQQLVEVLTENYLETLKHQTSTQAGNSNIKVEKKH